MHEQMIGVPQSALYFPLSILTFMLMSRVIGHLLLRKEPSLEYSQAMGVGFGITFHATYFFGGIVSLCLMD
jgi:hypothetical protein